MRKKASELPGKAKTGLGSSQQPKGLMPEPSPLSFKVAIAGSGTASLNAAIQLKRLGVDDIIVITEGVRLGTSANAGSDKQTYYRLNPAGPSGDSVLRMAKDLFEGGCMHGDTALVEAALSAQCFSHLCTIGVEFPYNEYGIFPGYRTDHDTKSRATSAGPNTSIMMHSRLLAECRRLGVMVLDGMNVVKILAEPKPSLNLHAHPALEDAELSYKPAHSADKGGYRGRFPSGKGEIKDSGKRVRGIVFLNAKGELQAILADYVIWGTGGPAALYADSAYPFQQSGSLGVALMAGARACNLTESQFGIASIDPRWNLSGSYQQVLPEYYSCNADGSDRKSFLAGYFSSPVKMCEAIFLKGYEWPFDVRKVPGSSVIDLLVYEERVVKCRKVFMDFTKNPAYPGWDFSIEGLSDTVRGYLIKSSTAGKSPVERLKRMNPLAYKLFLSKGVDIERDPLEVAVCNQHLNGGLSVDKWWETSIENLFAVGEAAGTHGTYRPGGSALNAGQVGGLRAAQQIAFRMKSDCSYKAHTRALKEEISGTLDFFDKSLKARYKIDAVKFRERIQKRASETIGIFRNEEKTMNALKENESDLKAYMRSGVRTGEELSFWYKNIDLLLSERAILDASLRLLERLRCSRGAFVYAEDDSPSCLSRIPLKADGKLKARDRVRKNLNYDSVIETWLDGRLAPCSRFDAVRPLPEPEDWFEIIWAGFMSGEVFER